MKKLKEFQGYFNSPRPDANTGGGYGRLGKSKGVGTTWTLPSTYPYKEEPEDDEESCSCDDSLEDDAFASEHERQKFLNKVNGKYIDADPLNLRIADKFAFVNGSTRLGERIETSDGRSGPYAPRVSGAKHGWSRPLNGMPWDEDDPAYELKDIPEPDERAIKKQQKIRDLIKKRQEFKENRLIMNLCEIFGLSFFFD